MIEPETRSALAMHAQRDQSPRDQSRIGQKSAGTSVTEVRIVEAAAQLFAHNGFKGTTTRDIAQLADLNEATLFRYFPRKPDLFWAAVESHVARVKLARDTQASLASDDALTVVVPLLVAFLLDNFNHQPQLQRLLHVAAFELPGSGKMIREHLGPIFDMVCAYFKRCAEKGTMRAGGAVPGYPRPAGGSHRAPGLVPVVCRKRSTLSQRPAGTVRLRRALAERAVAGQGPRARSWRRNLSRPSSSL